MSTLQEDDSSAMTEIAIQVKSLYRQKSDVFTLNRAKFEGIVRRPSHCRTKFGSGTFLFIGKVRFGKAHISCAPQWDEWQRIKRGKYARDCDLEQ